MSSIEKQLKNQSIGIQHPITITISQSICDKLRSIPENICMSLIVRNEITQAAQYEQKLSAMIDEIDSLIIASKCLSINLNYVFSQLYQNQLSSFE